MAIAANRRNLLVEHIERSLRGTDVKLRGWLKYPDTMHIGLLISFGKKPERMLRFSDLDTPAEILKVIVVTARLEGCLSISRQNG